MAAKLPSPFSGASSSSPPWLLLLFLFTLTSPALSSHSSKIPYSEHCGSVVAEPAGVGAQIFRPGHLELTNGYFTGGQQLFPEDPGALYSIPKSARFLSTRLYRSEAAGIFSVQTTLRFRGGSVYNESFVQSRTNLSSLVPHRRGRLSFQLRGFWSEASGKLCAIGTGFGYSKKGDILDLSGVFKLNYAKNLTIKTSLVSGSVESLSTKDSVNYFNPISIFGFSDSGYKYTLLSDAEKGCNGVDYGKQKPLSLENERSMCSILSEIASYGFQLEYPSDCKGVNCGPFNGSDGFLPTFMSLGNSDCKDGERMHFRLGFYNDSTMDHYYQPLAPQTTLVSEGVWDSERNRLCLVACRIVNFENSLASVDDCTIGLCLWVPQVLSIKDRSYVVGNMWSNRKADESGYFGKIVLKSMEKQFMRISGLKYEYTQLDLASKSCKRKDAKKTKGKKYADGQSYGDMRFDLSVKNADGKSVWGYSNPLTYGESFFENYGRVFIDSVSETSIGEGETGSAVITPDVEAIKPSPTLLNVSYFISFSLSPDFKWRKGYFSSMPSVYRPVDIFAEGIYDANNGTLCMVGCQNLGNSSTDCEIAINVQFPPVNPTAEDKLKGAIRSIREESDPLYFEPLELTSNYLYESQAKEWIWTLDMEMIMLLITLTLACIFIGLQILHVRKHPDVLPSTSLLMLLVLTLGHMIPLVLNFEAFFNQRKQQNVLSGNGGWLEVNEVIVRIITMVAFLLMFRLVQLVWSARLAEGTKKEFWISEMKAVRLCLPLYIIGALFAGFVHGKKSEVQILAAARNSVWEDLRSYGGLVLDGFLLPQILFSLFSNAYEKALSPSFYVGTTAVRSFPHAYDAYRAHHYIPHLNSTYIYANPRADLYSSTWDIIIPIGGLLFAVVVYLQQRYGGACILPRRLRLSSEYERVSVINE